MSFAVAVVGSDGIVMATDSKESLEDGQFQIHNAHKLTEISDGIWVACVSNYSGFTNHLVNDFINEVDNLKLEVEKNNRQWDIKTASEVFGMYANSEYLKLRQDPQKKLESQPLYNQIDFIFAGYTKGETSQPKIKALQVNKDLNLPPFASQENDWWVAGMCVVAEYWLTKIIRVIKLSNINSNVLKTLATLVFVETNNVTDLVGPPLEIVTIKPNSIVEKVSVTKTKLEQIGARLNAIVDGQTILSKITELSNHDLLI